MATGAELSIMIREKRFTSHGAPLFSQLSFKVAPSAAVAVLGPSGVGKSTLLRMIAGIDETFEGRVTIDGQPPAEAPTPGFVFQDPRLLPWLDAVGNILAVSPRTGAEAAAALLRQLGLAGSEHALPHELSGGMQRRVALARALAVAPRLLLLDEPFVSIDRKLARELQGVVTRIARTYAPTMLIVTHDADDAARLADRVILLEGTPARIVSDRRLDVVPAERTPETVARYSAELMTETGAAE